MPSLTTTLLFMSIDTSSVFHNFVPIPSLNPTQSKSFLSQPKPVYSLFKPHFTPPSLSFHFSQIGSPSRHYMSPLAVASEFLTPTNLYSLPLSAASSASALHLCQFFVKSDFIHSQMAVSHHFISIISLHLESLAFPSLIRNFCARSDIFDDGLVFADFGTCYVCPIVLVCLPNLSIVDISC